MGTPNTYDAVIDIVSHWPAEQRLRLMHELLDTLAPAETRLRRGTLAQALGLLATDQPPPSDEDVARWLAERRMDRYG